MNNSYVFDQFEEQQQKAEINRLTANIGSHAKDICNILLNHGLTNAKQVLDVGCGTGSMIALLSSIRPNATFVGIDSSKTMIEQAKQTNIQHAEWVHGEAHTLPFADNSFDFVYTRLVLLHNQNPVGILKEMKRVCKPNGVIVSIEIDDGTMIFYPYSDEFANLIKANIDYSLKKGMDRIVGRKLYPMYISAGIDHVKIVVQTSEFSGAFEDVPFPLRLALGTDEGQQLVDEGLLTNEERIDILHKIKLFSENEHRFYSGAFMYAIGIKE